MAKVRRVRDVAPCYAGSRSRDPRDPRAGGRPRPGRVFRPEQGPVPEFKFQVLKTEHFDIYFYPEEEAAARMTARMAERWYARLSKLLNHELRGRQPLILYASAPHFWQTTAIEGEMGEGTGRRHRSLQAAYRAAARRPDPADRPRARPRAGPRVPVRHHQHQRQLGKRRRPEPAAVVHRGDGGIPVDRPGRSRTPSMWMREAARREKLPTIDQLDDPRYFPYRYGHALWAYIGGRFGDEVVGDMLRAGGALAGRLRGRRSRACCRSRRRTSRRNGTTRCSRPIGRSPRPPRCRPTSPGR